MRLSTWLAAGLGAMLLAVGGVADALQLTLSGDERLHTTTSGQPGATWNTGGSGSGATGGEISYDSGTFTLSITGRVDTLNWYDPTDGGCPTDVGSNCSFNFTPDLDFELLANLHSIGYTVLAPDIYNVVVSFTSTGGIDLVVDDPTDVPGSPVLEASLASGTFGTTTTNGLEVSVIWDNINKIALTTPQGFGVLDVDTGSPYASLFEDGGEYFGIQVGSVFDFQPALNSLIQDLVDNSTLSSFTAEAQGEVFRSDAGQFELPEPGVGLLLLTGLGGLAIIGRRRR